MICLLNGVAYKNLLLIMTTFGTIIDAFQITLIITGDNISFVFSFRLYIISLLLSSCYERFDDVYIIIGHIFDLA